MNNERIKDKSSLIQKYTTKHMKDFGVINGKVHHQQKGQKSQEIIKISTTIKMEKEPVSTNATIPNPSIRLIPTLIALIPTKCPTISIVIKSLFGVQNIVLLVSENGQFGNIGDINCVFCDYQ